MVNGLKKYFPMIRSREEVLKEIHSKSELSVIFQEWQREQQEEFLDFCTGARGVKMLYDSFFKEIMNPDTVPERMEEVLSLLLNQDVKILKVLPNDSTRIADESSLLIMDIVVEMEDGSIANIEVQRLGYAFPGQRSACYSADLLLRQYKRVKGERKKKFSYRDIKKVYTIIFFEKSTKEFHEFTDVYLHHSKQKSDTGLEIELLQEFVFIALDIFRKTIHNKGIRNKLEAWTAFLSMDDPEEIARLIEGYPEFRSMYEEVYEICRNTEKVMNMFSKELQELDRNTVQYMIDEMQDTIDEQRERLSENSRVIESQQEKLNEKSQVIESQQEMIDELRKRLMDFESKRGND